MICDCCERAFHADCYVGDVEDDDGGEWCWLMCQEVPSVPRPDKRRKGASLTSSEMHVTQRLLL